MNNNGKNGEALRGSTGLLVGISFYGSRSNGTTVCTGAGELPTREALSVSIFFVNRNQQWLRQQRSIKKKKGSSQHWGDTL